MKTKINNLLFYSSIMLLILSFDLAHNTQSAWQKQELPDLGGRALTDLEFVDSLTGFASTTRLNDTSYILKTIDGGTNWSVIHFGAGFTISNIQFLNYNTGYAGGFGSLSTGHPSLIKTTDNGANWFGVNTPFLISLNDFHVLNEDTIWMTSVEASTGGIYLTTNGGASWTRKYHHGILQNPDKIYFYDENLGFARSSMNSHLRTSDGGDTWTVMQGSLYGFNDMHFIDSLNGWMARAYVFKTSDGGLSWYQTNLPSLNDTVSSASVVKISKLMSDSIMYAVGPRAFHTGLTLKGLIFKSTDRGENWGYQLPDTNKIKFKEYAHIFAIDANRVWAYNWFVGGIYTEVGGDTTYYTTSISQIGTNIPADFILHQNYPNPFNPLTKIRYELKTAGKIKLKVYDIRGREVSGPVDETQQAGVYEVNFSASEYGTVLSSGVYFYSLFVEDQIVDTKKMLLLK